MLDDLAIHGAAIVPGVLSQEEVEYWIQELGAANGPGRRGLLADPKVASLARSERLLALARPHLKNPVPARAIFFDKSPDANWLVPWHQDLTIAVQERAHAAGFGPWSVKGGIPHVQPPVALLEQMLTIRLHLDPADENNGGLRIIPGSHRHGKLSPDAIVAIRSRGDEIVCRAQAGDALLMRPLVLHASAKAAAPLHRRVLHIEYAGFELPDGLRWHYAT